jgi:hypothetical protein
MLAESVKGVKGLGAKTLHVRMCAHAHAEVWFNPSTLHTPHAALAAAPGAPSLVLASTLDDGRGHEHAHRVIAVRGCDSPYRSHRSSAPISFASVRASSVAPNVSAVPPLSTATPLLRGAERGMGAFDSSQAHHAQPRASEGALQPPTEQCWGSSDHWVSVIDRAGLRNSKHPYQYP